MDKLALLLLICMILGFGCRSNKHDRLPEVKPLPGEENVRITLDVNISDKPAVPANAVQMEADKKKDKQTEKTAVKPRKSNQVILSPRTKRNAEKKNAKRKRQELVPSGVGIIDSELNSVEQSYLREVRSRSEQQLRNSERQVFGSFSPDSIFKVPQD